MEIETLIYQGQDSFHITAATYTAVYHREGCGLAALFDADGHDWISYRPTGGEYGHYRGLPNMGLDAFGHPGYQFGAKTMLEAHFDDHIYLRSRSADGRWESGWLFTTHQIIQTILAADAPYWWLYEGTPAGRFQPEQQYLILDDGTRHPCHARYAAEVAHARTVTVVDPQTRRGLRLTAHTPEPTVDLYWPMGGSGGMTVWGFGRHDDQAPHPRLQQTPATFSVAFVENIR